MVNEIERKVVTKQNQFLNRWMIGYLKKDRRSCSHKIVTQFNPILENRLFLYVKCADCGRFIKLRKAK